MTTAQQIALMLALAFFTLLATAHAQTARLSTVNVTSDGERVHVAAQGDVSEMRVDVADEQGDVVFQSGAITGDTLDWKMRDAQGERVQPGTYLVTVTFRAATGKLRKRVEQVTVAEDEKSSTPPPAAPMATPVPVRTTGTATAGRIPKFYSVGTSVATITNSVITESTGKIGIGTAVPTAKLTLSGTGAYNVAGAARFDLINTTAHVGYLQHVTNDGLWQIASTSGATRMVINTSGNVGIGTINPSNGKLEVEGGTQTAIFGFSNIVGVRGISGSGTGVYGSSDTSTGVEGYSCCSVSIIARGGPSVRNLVEGVINLSSPQQVFHITPNGTYVAGSDFAEALPASGSRASYQPGDVLVLSPTSVGAVEKSSRPYDARVAGVYSTRPGLLGADKDGTSRVDPEELPVAIVGIVPTKVSAENGAVRVGDLLTTSSTPGYAMRCKGRQKCLGAIVGKAVEPLAEGKKVIKVLVMLR